MLNLPKRKIIVYSIGAVLCISMIVNFVFFIRGITGYVEAQGEYDTISSSAYTAPDKNMTVVEESEQFSSTQYNVPDFSVNHEELEGINPSYVGWIYIPSVDISYPVVASADNQDYLKKTFQGKTNASGCIFSDCRNNSPFKQRTILYGHNMKDGTMFAGLFNLEDEDLSKEIEVWAYIPDGTIQRYVITTVQRAWSTDESIYYVDADASTLILSTCVQGDERLVVICTKTATYI